MTTKTTTGRKRMTDDDRKRLTTQAVELYQGGASIRGVSEQLQVSYGTAHRLLTESRVELRPRGAYRGLVEAE